jgi:activating signal cointegrator complex subunit 3
MKQILDCLRSNDVENSLLDLLGFDHLEFVTELLSSRVALISELERSTARPSQAGSRGRPTQQTPAPQFSVKFGKKFQNELDVLARLGHDAAPSSSSRDGALDEFVDVTLGGAHRYVLPENAVRRLYDGVEEIKIPPSLRSPEMIDSDLAKLRAIGDLPNLLQRIFTKETHLNRIQSAVYPVAFESSENFLMAAPTSAGKTNVALLAIARLIDERSIKAASHIPGPSGNLGVGRFRVVYLAPMKALVAEVVEKFSARLGPLGVVVKELTGDMNLTRQELTQTHVIVTVPEKWDVVTRNTLGQGTSEAGGDDTTADLVIIDEVHMLNDERGSIIEALVARLSQWSEKTAKVVRFVALSATLPNYMEVAGFLHVRSENAFFFDASYRPVPLEQTLIGVGSGGGLLMSSGGGHGRLERLNHVCFEEVLKVVRGGHQVLVFVHARGETWKTADMLIEKAQRDGVLGLFAPADEGGGGRGVGGRGGRGGRGARRGAGESKTNNKLVYLLEQGFGVHHAGMLRKERNQVEKAFMAGEVRVLVSTATLAWGVNLPARAVIIKGTSVFDSGSGGFVDLGILDVQQIFGRAGRPQFDSLGQAVLITTADKLGLYVRELLSQNPVESRLDKNLDNALNAEVAMGNITTVAEAAEWLKYTFLFVRMKKACMKWGITTAMLNSDPSLGASRRGLVEESLKRLNSAKLVRLSLRGEEDVGVAATDLGRVAARFYVDWETAELFSKRLRGPEEAGGMAGVLSDAELLEVFALSKEFRQLKVREEEQQELEELYLDKTICPVKVRGGAASIHGKVGILLQVYITQHNLMASSLQSDLNYVAANAGRIFRCMFEICLTRTTGVSGVAEKVIEYCKIVERRQWDPPFHHLLRHFLVGSLEMGSSKGSGAGFVKPGLLRLWMVEKLESRNIDFWRIREDGYTEAEMGNLLGVPMAAKDVLKAVRYVPYLETKVEVYPISGGLVKVVLRYKGDWTWNDRFSLANEYFHVFVIDPVNEDLLHVDRLNLNKRQFRDDESISFLVPVDLDNMPPQYLVQVVSDRWVSLTFEAVFSIDRGFLPLAGGRGKVHTDLLDLEPLPVSALQDERFEKMFAEKFAFFNPIQTQVFHTLYHTDANVLIGAPTGSGKTIMAELAVFRVLKKKTGGKVVYIAPLKALSAERIGDWRKKFGGLCEVVELTGDFTPDAEALAKARIIITTPEKFDGISRSFKTRKYVREVELVVIDEVHLLGTDRGPVLEVIVSRMRYVSSLSSGAGGVRFVALSTALANAQDVADWLGVGSAGLFNFRPAVRPVPVEVHIQGFKEKQYCPRMGVMNKPCFTAIQQYCRPLESGGRDWKPALIFVSSRRQTRLTAYELIALQGVAMAGGGGSGGSWVGGDVSHEYLENVVSGVQDEHLKHTLRFGVGMHHAGLSEGDRSTVEKLFLENKILVLVATSTLAWGVNYPTHLVICKGTEYFDAKTKKYKQFPVTDVLQMVGRAGRPQFRSGDAAAVAVVLVEESQRQFYRQFLYSPFPVESELHHHLEDHLNAEIVLGSIAGMADALNYVSWTYFFRRLVENFGYYVGSMETGSEERRERIRDFVEKLLRRSLEALQRSGCVELVQPGVQTDGTIVSEIRVVSTELGKIAATYYMAHETVRLFAKSLKRVQSVAALLRLLADAKEYAEVPVRHNEDVLNAELAKKVPLEPGSRDFDNPHVKTFLLLQSHMWDVKPPIADYRLDLKNVLDQSVRLIQAMVDVASLWGVWENVHKLILIQQALHQGLSPWDDPRMMLFPDLSRKDKDKAVRAAFASPTSGSLAELVETGRGERVAGRTLQRLPKLQMAAVLGSSWASEVLAGSAVEVKVTVKLENFRECSDYALTSSRFGKKKSVGLWMALVDGHEVVAVRRVNLPSRSPKDVKFNINVPTAVDERCVMKLQVHLMPDAYLGLDQLVEFPEVVVVCDTE